MGASFSLEVDLFPLIPGNSHDKKGLPIIGFLSYSEDSPTTKIQSNIVMNLGSVNWFIFSLITKRLVDGLCRDSAGRQEPTILLCCTNETWWKRMWGATCVETGMLQWSFHPTKRWRVPKFYRVGSWQKQKMVVFLTFFWGVPGSFPNIFVSEIASKWRFYQHFSQWSMAREEKNPISWESNSPVTFSVENKPIIRGPQVPFVQKRQLVGNGFQAWFLWRQCVQ